jgi:hypothetical protein
MKTERHKKGIALLFVIFILLLFSLFAIMLASVFANRTELAKGFYRSAQVFYVNDMGMERAKQFLADNPTITLPYTLTEDVVIDTLTINYRIVFQQSLTQPGAVEITVESYIQ